MQPPDNCTDLPFLMFCLLYFQCRLGHSKCNEVYFDLIFLQGSGGITVKKTGQAMIFGIYEEPLTPGQCNMIVERLGDYLIDQGL